jgi:hypothetical protein
MVTGYEVEYYHTVANISRQMKRLADSQEGIVKVAVPALLSALQLIAERLPETPAFAEQLIPQQLLETPDEFRRRVEASTVDPEDHDYQGDGTSRCTVCLGTMNEHVSIGPVVWP